MEELMEDSMEEEEDSMEESMEDSKEESEEDLVEDSLESRPNSIPGKKHCLILFNFAQKFNKVLYSFDKVQHENYQVVADPLYM